MRSKLVFSIAILGCLLLATSLSAQATRTWVSGVGDDVNPCSRTAPCKTWAGAISKTATCGEINALDPGGYGALTITKSITVDGAGTHASTLFGGVNGFTINLAASDACNTVILRNLSLNGTGGAAGATGLAGIRILSSQAGSPNNLQVHLEHLQISHCQRGIDINHNRTGYNIHMKDVDIRHTTVHGIDVRPSGGFQTKLSMDQVKSRQSAGDALHLNNDIRGSISNSHFQSSANGVNVAAASVLVSLIETVMSQNTGTGLINGGTATTLIDGCTISNNNTGLLNNTGGTVFGFGNNAIAGNGAGGDVVGGAVQTAAHP